MKSLTMLYILIIMISIGRQDTSNVIIDPFIDIPFDIKKPELFIPDSLGGKNLQGKIILQIEVDSSGTVLNHKIMALVVSDSIGKININYKYSGDNDKKKVGKFNQFINEFRSKLLIRKNPNFDKRYQMEKYRINLPILIGLKQTKKCKNMFNN
jgi:hypothetical protein